MARGHELVVVRREHAQRTLRAGLGCATLLHVPKRAYTLRNLSVTAKETLTEEDAKIGFQLALASIYYYSTYTVWVPGLHPRSNTIARQCTDSPRQVSVTERSCGCYYCSQFGRCETAAPTPNYWYSSDRVETKIIIIYSTVLYLIDRALSRSGAPRCLVHDDGGRRSSMPSLRWPRFRRGERDALVPGALLVRQWLSPSVLEATTAVCA